MGTVRDVGRGVARGFNRLQQSGNLLLNEAGLISDEDAAKAIARDERDAASYSPSVEASRGSQKIADAKGWGATALAILTNPRAVLTVVGESLPASAAVQASGAALGMGGRNPTGLMAGTFAGSYATEYSSTIFDTMRDAGIDLSNEEQVAAALNDDKFMATARERGAKRGLPVAAFDAISFGLAGKISKAIERGGEGLVRRGTGAAAEVGAQAGAGAAGEAGAQLADKGSITSPSDVLLEAAGEVAASPTEILLGRKNAERQQQASAPEYTINDPGGEGDGTRVTLSPDQSGIPPTMRRVDMPDGSTKVLGDKLLNPVESIDGTKSAGAAATPPSAPVDTGRAGPPPSARPTDISGADTYPHAQDFEDFEDRERPNSPRLTPADRASPLPNNLIDDGKKVFEDALAGKTITPPTSSIVSPAEQARRRSEAEQFVGGISRRMQAEDVAARAAAPQQPAAAPQGALSASPVELPATAPSVSTGRVLTDAEFMGAPALDTAAHDAATSPTNSLPEPTQAMKEAGNYRLGHTKVGGLNISIENPQGSERSGVDPNGKAWSQTLQSHYGYIKGTVGKDKDHIDVFVKPGTPTGLADDAPVFVVDQKADDGSFDEHKVMMGFADRAEADAGYHANYQKGWKGAGAITQTTLGEFKQWLKEGDTAKPFAAETVDVRQRAAPTRKGPLDIVEFLASIGGLKDFKSELRSLDLSRRFVPGIGKLIRESGKTLDYAREAAEEAGYITPSQANQTTTIGDLLRAIEANERGQRVYSTHDTGRVQQRQAEKAQVENSEEQARRDDLDQTIKEYDLKPDEIAQVEAAMKRGEWASEAIVDVLERRAVAFTGKTRKSRTQKEPAVDDIPFDTGPEDATGEGAADASGRRQGDDERGSGRSPPPVEEPAQDQRNAGAPEGRAKEGALATEPGAEGKPQTVIPGAERISQKQQAEREAAKPMRAKVPQKDAGELFDTQANSERQGEMPFFSLQNPTEADFLRPAPRDLDEVLVGAEDRQAQLNDVGRRIGQEMGVKFVPGTPKERAAAAEKIARKGYKSASWITDIVRTGFIINTPEQADAINQRLAQEFDVLAEGWKREPTGYLDRKSLVRFGDGSIGEVQFWEENLYRARKEGGGHKLYKRLRSLVPGSPEAEAILRDTRNLYTAALAAAPEAWSRLGGSSLPKVLNRSRQAFSTITPPDVQTSQKSTDTQRELGSSIAFASDLPSTAGRPSQFTNFMGNTSREDITPSDEFRNRAQAIGARLRAELDRLGLKDIGLRISEQLGMMVDGMLHAADGSYFRKLISIALDAENPDAVLDHEAIHALRDVKAFGKDEWAILERQSRKKWMADHKIADAYGNFSEAVQVEEGIAHAYAAWRAGRQTDGIVAKSFKKIAAILKAIARAFGKDFRSAEDVFAQVASGEIGNRPRADAQASEPRFAIRGDERRTAPAPEARRSLSDIQAAVATRIMNAIKGGPGKNDGETIGDYSMRKMVDYLQPLRRMIETQGAVEDRVNAYQEARLALDAAVASVQDMHGKYVTPAVEALAEAGATLEDLHRYLYALHAEERNKVVGLRNEPDSDFYKAVTDLNVKGASGWSTNQARSTIQRFRNSPKFAAIDRAAKLFRQMLDENLLAQRNAGLISDATYQELTQQWQHYVPLHAEEAVDENGDFQMPGRGRGFDVRGKEFKGATGRFTEAENIPAWAISSTERSKLRQAKNKVGKSILRFINEFDPNGTNLAEVYWSDGPGFGNITKAPTVYRRELDKSGKVVNKVVPYSTISPDMYAVKVAGKTFYVKFADAKVGQALKNMNAVQMYLLFRLSRKLTNFQSLVNTRANPAFIPTNFFRDALTGAIHLLDEGFTGREVANILGDIPQAWAAVWRGAKARPGTGPMDQALAEMTKVGGRLIFEQQKTIEDSIKSLHRQMQAAQSGKGSPRAMWNGLVKFVEDVNDTVEMGVRLSAYSAARAKGKTAKQAAFLARDLTVDFRKHGEVGPHGNALYTFFNASVQGNFNVAKRLLSSRKVQAASAAIMLSGFALDMINRSISGDDDDGENRYEKMLRNEPWKFERQMVIFYGPGEGSYFTIPLPYGYNAIYHTGLQLGAAFHGDVKPMEAMSNSTRVLVDAFNPMGGGGGWVNMFSPTFLDPFIEIDRNRNFADIPIYPTTYPGDVTPDSQKSFKNTPDVFKWAAEQANAATGGNSIEPGAIDIHPDSIEHMWDFVSGGLGRFFGSVADPAWKAAQGRSDEIEVDKLPFIRSFYGEQGDDNKRSEYYKLREDVQTAKSRLKDYKDAGDAEDLQGFRDRFPVEIAAIPAFDAAEKRLRKIRAMRRRLEAGGASEDRLAELDDAERKAMTQARFAYAQARAKHREAMQ